MTHAHDPATAALIARFGNAKPASSRNKPQPGKHVFALVDYGFKPTENHGTILAVEFEVLQSDSMQSGTKAEIAFYVSKTVKEGGEKELGRAMAFTNALTGDGPADAKKFAENSAKLIQPTQPGRGLVISCTAWSQNGQYGEKSEKAGQPKRWIEMQWDHIADQSQQAAIRGMLDAKYPIAAPVAAPPPAPQYGPPPGPYGAPPAGYAPYGGPQGLGQPAAGYGYAPPAAAPAPAQPAAPAAPPAWGGWTPPR